MKTAVKSSNRTPVYFYINGNLHRRLHINRAADEMLTWCYPLTQRVTYVYTDARRRMEPAFTTAEVCKMLNRGRDSIEDAILRGHFKAPQFTYGLNERKRKFKYMWHESNILEAHDYYSTVHVGRPRKDGLVTPKRMPTKRELRAIIRNKPVLYIQDGDDFKPVWDAPDI